ncbi:MAG: hypothetical protein PHY92_02280 [Alphaproteobacteria bacterium]|nr:hypothetical protein [Alphaproteobacteria bacterium]
MHQNIRSIIAAAVLLLLLYWLGSDVTSRTNFIVFGFAFVGIGTVFWDHAQRVEELSKRLLNAETALNRIGDSFSYRLIVAIKPKWFEILQKICGEKDKFKELMDGGAEKNLEEDFSFIEFYDSLSEQKMLWSDVHKTFVKEFLVAEPLFPEGTQASQIVAKMLNVGNFSSVRILIAPSSVSLWDYHNDKGEKISLDFSQIPFDEIKRLLITTSHRDPFLTMKGIKTFPTFLQRKFDEYNVKYKPHPYWRLAHMKNYFDEEFEDKNKILPEGLTLYDSEADCHEFETEFYKLTLHIDFSKHPSLIEGW